MRIQDVGFVTVFLSAPMAIVLVTTGYPAVGMLVLLIAMSAAVVARVESRRNPGPMSPALRWALHLPRGTHSSKRLLGMLQPKAGECILEVGPGDGVHSIPIARALGSAGVLEVLDIQPKMLESLKARADAMGIQNIRCSVGTAERLPYPDSAFDAAFLITVLGEIPNQSAALNELKRVLRASGRLVIGETIADPDYVSPSSLARSLQQAGFNEASRIGQAWSYLSCFRPGVTEARPDHSLLARRP